MCLTGKDLILIDADCVCVQGVFTEMAEASELDMADGDDRDPETYDDGDFYQTLLKEFFEGKQDTGTNWYTVSVFVALYFLKISFSKKLI